MLHARADLIFPFGGAPFHETFETGLWHRAISREIRGAYTRHRSEKKTKKKKGIPKRTIDRAGMKGCPTLFSKSERRAVQRVFVLLSYPISSLRREQQLLPLLPSLWARSPRTRTRKRFIRRRRCSAQGTFVHKRSWLCERARLPSVRYAIRLSFFLLLFLT